MQCHFMLTILTGYIARLEIKPLKEQKKSPIDYNIVRIFQAFSDNPNSYKKI